MSTDITWSEKGVGETGICYIKETQNECFWDKSECIWKLDSLWNNRNINTSIDYNDLDI